MSRASLIWFLVLVIGGGLAIGYVTAPGEWFAGLAKPSFNPPGWLFAPVWTILYVLIAVAGWRVWRLDAKGWPMRLWWVQLVLNFAWPPVFFRAHRLDASVVIILLLLATIVAFIITARRLDRAASWLFVPYALWVAFASFLNIAIYRMN